MATGDGVQTRHNQYVAFQDKWRRVRDVVSGQDAVHGGGTLYLPKLLDQELSEYLAYVDRTPFYNASWRTIAGFIGMLFRKPPTLEVPKTLEAMLDDVTMSGVSFSDFARDCALEDLEVSRLGVLVDHPAQLQNEDGSPVTVAQAQAAGQRPSMQMYKTENIINWRYGRVNNATVLTQVRLLELHETEKSEFEYETESRIRVLDLIDGFYRVRVFKEDNGEQIGSDVYPTINNKKLTSIPFFFIGPDGTEGAIVDDPVMIDLIDLNLKHYQVSADYEHGCHMTGLPTPVISGYKPGFDDKTGQPIKEKFYIGSATAWIFPDAQAKAEFLEFTGQGLDALEKNLARKEGQMAAIGARMLAPEKSGVEAAETLAIRHSGENSILSSIAIAVSDGLTKALKVFAEWAGIAGECKFQINRDFVPMSVDAQTLTAWLGLVQAGQMSTESLFDLLKRADIVDAELSFEDEQARIDANPIPTPAGIGYNSGPGLDDPDNPDDPKPEPKPGDE
jgi:hypothetical protein